MKKSGLFVLAFFVTKYGFAQSTKAPAYPLITQNPYFSIWSTTDKLTVGATKHWTATDHSLIGLLEVDGKMYRFLGEQSRGHKTILPAGDELNYTASYTETTPGDGWMDTAFDDSKWQKGKAPFGDNKAIAKTIWMTKDIWVRREFNISNTSFNKLFLKLQHDDDVEIYLNGAVQYFKQNLKPRWKLDGSTIEQQLSLAAKEYAAVIKKCVTLNQTIHDDVLKAGGENYAKLCELAYRQSIAAHKLVKSPEGELLFLSKENYSNGSINTVDITYPSAPLYLAYNPELLKGMLNGIYYYSESCK